MITYILLVIITIFIIICILYNYESNERKEEKGYDKVKVGFEHFWDTYLTESEKPYINNLLSMIPNSEYEKDLSKCDVIFHSQFGKPDKTKFLSNVKYIFWSGEYWPFEMNNYKVTLSNFETNQINITYPFFFAFYHSYDERIKESYNKNQEYIADKFCAFIASNTNFPGCKVRNEFFHYLNNNYKRVDSYGRAFNNVNIKLDFPYNDKKQLELLKKHKFVICFENTRTDDWYITEKLFLAKYAGCLPIYWGTIKCKELFNQDAFLYLEEDTETGFENLKNKIIELDNNDELYLSMRNKELIKEETKMKFNKTNIIKMISQRLYK